MDLQSRNFWAEVLGKYLGADEWGRGTIANGARAIDRFTDMHGQDFRVIRLLRPQLREQGDRPWDPRAAVGRRRRLVGPDLCVRRSPRVARGRSRIASGHPDPREDGDPRRRLGAVGLGVAGAHGGWVEFSILSSGFNEWTAKKIEDRIVRIVSFRASPPP